MKSDYINVARSKLMGNMLHIEFLDGNSYLYSLEEITDIIADQQKEIKIEVNKMKTKNITVIPLEEYVKLAELFEEAVAHLDYCGYGDSWERDCAREENLAPRLESMLKRVEKILELNK